MEKVIVNVETRSKVGKKNAKDLRNKGLVPGNVYKGGEEAMSIQMSAKELDNALQTKAGENVLITLKISGGEKAIEDKTVLIKELQREPIKFGVLHVDFGEISLTDLLKVNVPLITRGEPVGVKIDGGILEHVMREVHVECLPTAIPEKIEIDVAGLKIGDAIFVKNITPPEGVKITNDPELIAVIVKAPRVEVAAGEGEAEEAAAPELIRKKKEEGEEEAGEAPKEPAKSDEKKK